MLLADKYFINVRYQRATRIDNDLAPEFFLVWYFMARLKTHSARSASSIRKQDSERLL